MSNKNNSIEIPNLQELISKGADVKVDIGLNTAKEVVKPKTLKKSKAVAKVVEKERKETAPRTTVSKSRNPFGKEKARLEGRLKQDKNRAKVLSANAIVEWLEKDISNANGLFNNINRVKDNAVKAKLKMDLMKMVLPKPKSQDEVDNERKIADGLHDRYFGKANDQSTFEED